MDPRLVALDLGSNSILLLSALSVAPGDLREEAEFFRITRLARGLRESGRLGRAAIDQTTAAIRDFLADLPRDARPVLGVAAATSAVRDAANRNDLLDACRDLLGASPHVLTGTDEARTTFLGAASDQPADRGLLTVDVGGGSTEIAWGTRDACAGAVSVDVGCVRLAEQHDHFNSRNPKSEADARRAVRALLEPALEALGTWCAARQELRLVATGGTATTLAAMHLGLVHYDRERVHNTTFSARALHDATRRLLHLNPQQRAVLPGVPPERADVLPAGLLILDTFLPCVPYPDLHPDLHISTRGLRFGLLRRLLSGDLAPTWRWPEARATTPGGQLKT